MTRGQVAMIACCAVLMTALAGCGSAPAAKASSTSTSSSSKGQAAPLKTATVTVGGKSETVLTTLSGMTVYYFTKDTPTKSACTGSCASIWPPVLSSATKVTSPSGLTGSVTVVKDQNGDQLAYNGHLLYMYSSDSGPGQANGEGVLNEWWVATPTLAAASGSSTSSGSGW